MEPIEKLPIYLVITEPVYMQPWSSQYALKFIKKIIECDIAELDAIYRDIVNPMYAEGFRIQVDMYLREPPSPFRSWKEIELKQREEAKERDRLERIDYLRRTAPMDDKPGALPGDN